ncbi:iron-siderophore ABC transporter substrate-binding protein [Microbacterium sp. JB110]|uniref:iron-siderophore ABC transporter substrate-binding protein n=1 Tax=Microbacterium sp. JB110 TaxID=2024477 RepID=UPI00097F0765|nr:iron-siderophore ABC transporter substrate-binding protein [Microbacterium sp. JB110]RCS62324.1 iron-siderophore ABC transporter substrate-binding protein [Microbacterium sp. JB110]SJM44287.1 Iron compound ABC uptake transporter substrate-binding protein PiaA [Frigoribacterium sp. JB110]
MRSRHLLAVTSLAASALLLASCATDGEGSEASVGDSGGIEITHALGTTQIPDGVERVATVGWGNQDVALALGVAPVGVDDQTWSMASDDGLGLYDWSLDGYEELGADDPVVFDTTDGVDFTAIADAQPDLILAAYSGLTQEEYDTLTEIAPTVAYPEVAWYTPWRDVILTDAEALGQADEGEQLVEDLDQQIADATSGLTSFEGKKAAFFYMTPADLSTASIYATEDSRTAFLGDLGFDFPDLAVETTESGSFYADISAENADQIADVDVIVAYGDDTLLDALQSDPLWSTVPAVQNGAVVAVGSGDAFSGAVTPTALSIPWMLDDYVSLLDDAASKAE